MQRRHFLQRSTLSMAGLFTARSLFFPDTVASRQLPALAVFCPESQAGTPALAGAMHMLNTSGLAFDLLDQADTFSRYAVVLLPDIVRLTPDQARQLEVYLDRGGAVVASYQSGLTLDGSAFASPRFGLRRVGEAPCSPDFLAVPDGFLANHLSDRELLMYLRGTEVQPDGATVLAWTKAPQPDPALSPAYRNSPGVTCHGKVVYFMHPIFTQYAHSAPGWCKQLVMNSLSQLLPKHVSHSAQV